MKDDDIWFGLYLGNMEVTEDGKYDFDGEFTRFARLKPTDINSVSEYREHLHRMLDKAIDHIDATSSGGCLTAGKTR